MSATLVVTCREHYAITQRAVRFCEALGVDKGVILMVQPPKDEEVGRHWEQLSLLSCEVCEWERDGSVLQTWTRKPWWQDLPPSEAKA